MEWLAFIVSIVIIVTGYLIMKYHMLEKAMIKLLDEFFDRYNDNFDRMSDGMYSNFDNVIANVYKQHSDDFNKIVYQTVEIKALLIEIRKLSDTRFKNEKQIQRLKSILDRQERKNNKEDEK